MFLRTGQGNKERWLLSDWWMTSSIGIVEEWCDELKDFRWRAENACRHFGWWLDEQMENFAECWEPAEDLHWCVGNSWRDIASQCVDSKCRNSCDVTGGVTDSYVRSRFRGKFWKHIRPLCVVLDRHLHSICALWCWKDISKIFVSCKIICVVLKGNITSIYELWEHIQDICLDIWDLTRTFWLDHGNNRQQHSLFKCRYVFTFTHFYVHHLFIFCLASREWKP